MKKFLLITMMMFLATFVVKAQDTNKNHDNTETTGPMTASYCMSFSDYKDNKWTTVENVVRKTRSIGTKIWSGGGDYSFLAETDELTKLLKKKVFAVIYNDTLYISLKNLKHGGALFGSGYNKALRCKDGSLIFAEKYISKIASFMQIKGWDNKAIDRPSEENQLQKRVWYIVSSDAKNIDCIADKYMKKVFADKQDILDKYNNFDRKHDSSGGDEKYNAARILPLLKEIGLLE